MTMADQLVTSIKNGKLSPANKKIIEIKKKIQLSEGQRKANFEECDATKRKNAERIIRLKKEVKELQVEFARAKNNDEAAEHATQMSRESSAYMKKRSLEEAIGTVDEDSVRLRKKLDLIKYRTIKQQNKLAALLREYEELMSGGTRRIIKKKREIPLKKKIVNLENQLHRVSVMQMEADMVRKKYICVRSSLKMDSVFYASWLQDLADDIKEQQSEIKRLEKVKQEAIELSRSINETLMKEEIESTNATLQRDTLIQDYRKRVEDRKLELECLERIILPVNRHLARDDVHDDDNADEDGDSKNIPRDQVAKLEEAFIKLRSATGVTKTEDVLKRFFNQRVTKERLQKMQATAENEKMTLEKRRQQLTAEIEMRKFSETKDADQNAEKLENLNGQIEEQRKRKQNAETKKHETEDLFCEINETIWNIYNKCQQTGICMIFEDSQSSEPIELLKSLGKIVKWLYENIDELENISYTTDEIITKKLEVMSIENTSDDENEENVDERPLFPIFPVMTTPGGPQQQSEDEEEIFSRNLLKRQAQIIVDTKNRRKGFNLKR